MLKSIATPMFFMVKPVFFMATPMFFMVTPMFFMVKMKFMVKIMARNAFWAPQKAVSPQIFNFGRRLANACARSFVAI